LIFRASLNTKQNLSGKSIEKEIEMSRLSKFSFVLILLLFSLACKLVTQPIQDVQDSVSTVESIATTMPLETLQSLVTSLPVETLQSFGTSEPVNTVESFGNALDPQGEPVAEWNGIPVMPEATAGQEIDTTTYSFKVEVTVKEVEDFYKARLSDLGWKQPFDTTVTGNSSFLIFQKEAQTLTVSVTTQDGYILVMLILV
jgi:hypothetical protein